MRTGKSVLLCERVGVKIISMNTGVRLSVRLWVWVPNHNCEYHAMSTRYDF